MVVQVTTLAALLSLLLTQKHDNQRQTLDVCLFLIAYSQVDDRLLSVCALSIFVSFYSVQLPLRPRQCEMSCTNDRSAYLLIHTLLSLSLALTLSHLLCHPSSFSLIPFPPLTGNIAFLFAGTLLICCWLLTVSMSVRALPHLLLAHHFISCGNAATTDFQFTKKGRFQNVKRNSSFLKRAFLVLIKLGFSSMTTWKIACLSLTSEALILCRLICVTNKSATF